MSDDEEIQQILIDRDVRAFVARDWSMTADDFDRDFAAYSGVSGELRLAYPDLDAYREDWMRQAEHFAAMDSAVLGPQLKGAQRLSRIEVAKNRAMATKVFDGAVDGPEGTSRLDWTSHYFLRRAADRWLITGFVGYLPSGGAR